MHLHVHLISDTTGETVNSVARAVFTQYEDLEIEEHFHSLIRTKGQIGRVVEEIRKTGGIVMFTIVDKEIRKILKEKCKEMGVLCIPVLADIISNVSDYLGVKSSKEVGRKLIMDYDYFSRVAALNFTLNHDDGQAFWNLEEAEVVLVGVSRTSKSPTCIYIANRGYKTANVPFINKATFPKEISKLKNPLVVGLHIHPETLIQIRKNRLLSIDVNEKTDYTDIDKVEKEVDEAKKYFAKNNWFTVDVTRRSIEETATIIIKMIEKRKAGIS